MLFARRFLSEMFGSELLSQAISIYRGSGGDD
jgi:hypothetical protein